MSNSLRKAAIVLMSLPREQASQMMSKLSPKQVEAVSIQIAQLGRINEDEQQTALQDFTNANPKALGGGFGSLDVAASLVEQALGEKAPPLIDAVRRSVEATPFGFLKNIDPQNVLTFINDEHPQTIALILSHLPPAFGAQIIGGLSPERQLAVIRRIANMAQTSPDVIQEVEQGLERRMASMMNEHFEKAGGVPNVAGILNVTDRATERALLEKLSQEDPELVEEIRRLMFVFEDLTKLSDKDIQQVLKNVENSQWSMALKNASEELKTKILGNMSQRAAQMLTEEMDYLGPVRLSEVEAMQQQIVDVVRRLEDAGQITVGGEDANDEFVT